MKTDHLLFGAAYYSEYLPYDRVEKDMEMMEKAGMNTIRIAESTWSTIEPKDGIFDFTHLDKMLEAAARHHISVIVGTPTYAIPAWLAKKYPDILALTNNGKETTSPTMHTGVRIVCFLYSRMQEERRFIIDRIPPFPVWRADCLRPDREDAGASAAPHRSCRST